MHVFLAAITTPMHMDRRERWNFPFLLISNQETRSSIPCGKITFHACIYLGQRNEESQGNRFNTSRENLKFNVSFFFILDCSAPLLSSPILSATHSHKCLKREKVKWRYVTTVSLNIALWLVSVKGWEPRLALRNRLKAILHGLITFSHFAISFVPGPLFFFGGVKNTE